MGLTEQVSFEEVVAGLSQEVSSDTLQKVPLQHEGNVDFASM